MKPWSSSEDAKHFASTTAWPLRASLDVVSVRKWYSLTRCSGGCGSASPSGWSGRQRDFVLRWNDYEVVLIPSSAASNWVAETQSASGVVRPRYGGGMLDGFDEDARQVIVLAQDESRALRHKYIGTEHILLGLLREEEGLAARTLASFEITLEAARAKVVQLVGNGDAELTGQIPFTPRARKVLELALRESLSLGHNYIGTEHILLGVMRESERESKGDGVGADVLLDSGAGADEVREAVLRLLNEAGRHPAPPRRRWRWPKPGNG
jgi:Clp amino terminal domain, pathogenicity island component